MAHDYAHYNDGSGNPPRIRFQHSLWALGKLPMNSDIEWTLDEKLARVAEAGFEAVECWPGDTDWEPLKSALDSHGLRMVMGCHANDASQIPALVERALRVGADYVFLQPANAFADPETVADMARAGRAQMNAAGLSFFVETHRNNYTENLPQTFDLMRRVPDLRLTGDLSHFVVVGEYYGWREEGATGRLGPVLERISHLHGRISNGEAVQVDVGDGSGETPQFFVRLWAEAIRHWLTGAVPGDVMPFTPELGPPRYAITLPDGREFSDRWEQSLVMRQLGQQAWDIAKSTS